MAVGGGYDDSWLAPLDDRGNRPNDPGALDEMIGQHSGLYAGLNIVNPQPDFEYSWARNSDNDRLLVKLRGGQIVQSGDPEMAAFNADPSSTQSTPIDSVQLFGDVILVRTPVEKVRAEREETTRRARAQLRDAGSDFVDKASGVELDPNYSGGRPTRFKRDDHMITFEDDSGRTVDQWTPDIGIVREKVKDF